MGTPDKKTVIRDLIELGKSKGQLSTKEILDALGELDFEPEQIEKFKEKYQSPEVFTLFNGELHVMKMPPQEQKEQKESRKKDAQQKNPAKGKKKNRSGEAR